MKLKTVIKLADELKPNAFSNELKTQWINECEGLVQTEVLLLSCTEIVSYDYASHSETELLVQTPHDKIYAAYLCAMIDLAHGEYNKYQNSVQVFNTYLAEYSRWFADRYAPANGEADRAGYYLSAYGLALKHGYTGTEQQWIESLKGERGEQGEKGDQGERGEPGAPGVSDLSGDGVSGILPVDKGGTGAASPYQAARRLGRTTAICNDSADTALIQIYENKINNFSATYGCILAVFFKNGNTAPGLELATRRTASSSVYRSVVYNNETGSALTGSEIKPNNVYLFSWTEKANGLPDRWVLLNPSTKSIRDALPTNSAPLPVSRGGTGGVSAFQAARRLGRTYYNCNAAANAANIIININTFGVGDGCLLFLRFTNGNTAASPNLTVTNTADNKSTSAIIYDTYTDQPLKGTEIRANQVCQLTYDSGNSRWVLLNPIQQEKITGTKGQVVMINENGAAEAQDAVLGFTPQIVVTAPTGSTVTCTKGSKTLTATEVSGTWTFDIPEYGTWGIQASEGNHSFTENVVVNEVKQYSISVHYTPIYGVQWDGSATSTWSRTDNAASFTNPVPYVSGATSYSSPFDSLQPWAGMTKTEDSEAGTLVAIPKYWYKWTKSGNTMKLQIADEEVSGFLVSPAHADRGDGKGERDIVYVGRYHCVSDYRSTTGALPLDKITRATARTNIHNLGATIWQYDFAMYWTICMLYLVEFADWNSQKTIGSGCSPSGSVWNMGYTDSMPYHTGTTATSRTNYGGTQYRHIEGLWDNVTDWCDGIYFSGADIYCIKNPALFSDISSGTKTGIRSMTNGYIGAWEIPTASGFEYALFPALVGGSQTTYVCDNYIYSANGVVLRCGGFYSQGSGYGLFYLYGANGTSFSNPSGGCRLQKLP